MSRRNTRYTIGGIPVERNAPNSRRRRLIQAWLAFPLAALVGFGGSLLVRSFWPDAAASASPSTRSPRPAGADLDRPFPLHRT
jgi:hypothetical protein